MEATKNQDKDMDKLSRFVLEKFQGCMAEILAELQKTAAELDAKERRLEEERKVLEEERECFQEGMKQASIYLQEQLESQRTKLESEKKVVTQIVTSQEGQVELDVGGVHYTTSLAVLTRYPDSMLGAMFSGRYNMTPNAQGRYFIDRDGQLFYYVLHFLRNGTILMPQEPQQQALLRLDIEFYQLQAMLSAYDHHSQRLQEAQLASFRFDIERKHKSILLSNGHKTFEHVDWYTRWATAWLRPSVRRGGCFLFLFSIDFCNDLTNLRIGLSFHPPSSSSASASSSSSTTVTSLLGLGGEMTASPYICWDSKGSIVIGSQRHYSDSLLLLPGPPSPSSSSIDVTVIEDPSSNNNNNDKKNRKGKKGKGGDSSSSSPSFSSSNAPCRSGYETGDEIGVLVDMLVGRVTFFLNKTTKVCAVDFSKALPMIMKKKKGKDEGEDEEEEEEEEAWLAVSGFYKNKVTLKAVWGGALLLDEEDGDEKEKEPMWMMCNGQRVPRLDLEKAYMHGARMEELFPPPSVPSSSQSSSSSSSSS
ncbi:BTB/POZ domain-containing protein kctd14 [Balamuthia mandrillaris]